ncbi:60S ribosomal protein L13 [Bienertia sinuspersici]
MSYRSKRTISNLATDTSKRLKKPTPPLVSQSSTAANTATPPPPPNEENDTSESKKLIKQLPPKGTHTSPQMPSFSSKALIKWGPFCPPSNGTHPETFNSNPQATKPLGSSTDDGNQSSIKTKSTTSKSETIFSNKNIGGNQMPIGSSTTTFSRDNNDRIAVKPPDHVQQERIRLTAQLQHQKNSVMLHQRHENSRDTINMRQEGGGKATYMQQEMQESSRRTTNMQQQGSNQTRDKSNNSKAFKTRLSFKIDGWTTEVEYDAKEEVLTVDANGKIQFVSGSIQPIDILGKSGVKYYVEFNELHQPIRKGGHILVRFLGSIAKMAYYCPIGALTWHDVEKNLKVQIVNKMREHFIIPDDEVYDTLAQQRIKKTHEQHYDLVPSGHSRSDWIKLVDHWFTPKGQRHARFNFKHTQWVLIVMQIFGLIMKLNMEKNGLGRGLGKESHEKGRKLCCGHNHRRLFSIALSSFSFISDAKAKVDLLKLNNSSSSSVDVEDEAFHSLMNGGDIPELPLGFGFGVKKSDVYGVRGILRKQGSRKVKIRDLDVNASVSNTNKTNEVLKKENRELSMKNDENTRTLKTVLTQFSQILDSVRKGKASVELIDAAQSALHMAIPEVKYAASSGDGATTETEDAPTKSPH